mmetsp:Transcript_40543/g.60094  ORF Transcript_40543/g.60094 Transcript_40543/m.60094 type:complete len:177 (+) Transcript_40543:71-601(+)
MSTFFQGANGLLLCATWWRRFNGVLVSTGRLGWLFMTMVVFAAPMGRRLTETRTTTTITIHTMGRINIRHKFACCKRRISRSASGSPSEADRYVCCAKTEVLSNGFNCNARTCLPACRGTALDQLVGSRTHRHPPHLSSKLPTCRRWRRHDVIQDHFFVTIDGLGPMSSSDDSSSR